MTIVVNRTIQILLIYLFIANLSASLFGPIFAVFITKSIAQASLRTVGFAISIYSITKLLVQIPLARFLDRRQGEKDEFYAMALGSLLGTAYMFGLVFTDQIWQLYALEIVSGIADASLMAAYYAVFSHHIDKRSQGFEWSLFSTIGLTISVACGGAIGGVLADRFGFQQIFLIAATINAMAVLLILLLRPYLERARRQYA
jgi:MFS family permease